MLDFERMISMLNDAPEFITQHYGDILAAVEKDEGRYHFGLPALDVVIELWENLDKTWSAQIIPTCSFPIPLIDNGMDIWAFGTELDTLIGPLGDFNELDSIIRYEYHSLDVLQVWLNDLFTAYQEIGKHDWMPLALHHAWAATSEGCFGPKWCQACDWRNHPVFVRDKETGLLIIEGAVYSVAA